MSPSKVCPQCQASVPPRLKVCKSCQHVLSKRKAELSSLSDKVTKRVRVSKATKRASETSEQTLHRQQQDRKPRSASLFPPACSPNPDLEIHYPLWLYYSIQVVVINSLAWHTLSLGEGKGPCSSAYCTYKLVPYIHVFVAILFSLA